MICVATLAVGLLTFAVGVTLAVCNGLGGYAVLACGFGWGLVIACEGVGCFCAGCWGGLAIALFGVANLGAGLGIFGMGADAEADLAPENRIPC